MLGPENRGRQRGGRAWLMDSGQHGQSDTGGRSMVSSRDERIDRQKNPEQHREPARVFRAPRWRPAIFRGGGGSSGDLLKIRKPPHAAPIGNGVFDLFTTQLAFRPLLTSRRVDGNMFPKAVLSPRKVADSSSRSFTFPSVIFSCIKKKKNPSWCCFKMNSQTRLACL